MRDWDFVELLREYILVNQTLSSLFDRLRDGEPCFAEMAELVGDSESSILFRLKERCHAQFRKDSAEARDMHREVLFDLTVGSLFHEAMKLRENLYQQEVYVPKVERLLEEHGPDDSAFFKEFETVQSMGADRTQTAMQETEGLLSQTRNQLRALLATHSDDSLMTRSLFENRGAVESVFNASLSDLFQEIHKTAAAGYATAAESFLESAFFDEANACLDAALAENATHTDGSDEWMRLRHYAEGMAHFSTGAFEQSLDSLEIWLGGTANNDDPRFLRFADSALSRFGKIVSDDTHGATLLARAEAVTRLIEIRLPARDEV